MAIGVQCGACGHRFGLSEAQAGRLAHCPSCRRALRVPEQAAAQASAPAGRPYTLATPPKPYQQGRSGLPPIQVPVEIDELEVVEDAPPPVVIGEAPPLIEPAGAPPLAPPLTPPRVVPESTSAPPPASEDEHPLPYDLKPPVRRAELALEAPGGRWSMDRMLPLALALGALVMLAGISLIIYRHAPWLQRFSGTDPTPGKGPPAGATPDQRPRIKGGPGPTHIQPTVTIDQSHGPPAVIVNRRPGNQPLIPLVDTEQPQVGGYEAIVYPAVPGSFMAVLREASAGRELIAERWTIAPWKKTAEARFQAEAIELSPPQRNAASQASLVYRHSISPGGEYLARLAEGKIAVWSYEQNRLVHQIDIIDKKLSLQLAGFYDAEHFAVLWFRGTECRAELFSARTGKSQRVIPLPVLELNGGRTHDVKNVGFSPDGKLLAAVGAGSVKLYDLASGRVARELNLAHQPHQPLPSQTVFSQDGRHIGLLYDRTFNVSMLSGPADGSGPLREVQYPNLNAPYTGGHAHAGRALDFLPDGECLLLYGQVVAHRRGLVGQTESPPALRRGKFIISQRRIAPDTFQIEVAEFTGGTYRRSVNAVKLDLGRVEGMKPPERKP